MPSITLVSLVALALAAPAAAEVIDLAGDWRHGTDPQDVGRDQRWFARRLTGRPIHLPGSLQGNGIGDPVTVATRWTGGIFDKSYFTAPEYAPYREPGHVKVPFWLQPETHFTGVAWYQREIEVPAGWSGKHVTLILERPHWKTTVWLDDREIGSSDALSVPHHHVLGTGVSPGPHVVTIRVDNTLDPDIGENSHSVSDHTQGNWNGIVGRLELVATAPVWIEELSVIPRVDERTAEIRGRLGRVEGHALPAAVHLLAPSAPRASLDAAVTADGSFSASYAFGPKAELWDELTPTLYTLTARLDNGETRDVRFGFRQVAVEGRRLRLNGRPLFLRGTLDCAAFPKTGHPPTEVASWERILRTIKAHGLNHVRFHSWCPPEAAFAAADALGVYLQVEAATWPNWTTTLGDGKPVDAWIEAETKRILDAYGHHPSFLILSSGNEPGGDRHAEWLARWTARWKSADPRRLYTAAAGWPEIRESDFHLRSEPRIQHWSEGLASRINARPPETASDYGDFVRSRTAPVVSHEIGQWCAYPNFAEMPKYTGYLKPRNFEIFQASLEAKGLGGRAHDFLMASGKLQALCYKEDIESSLRTREMGGFQLLGLSDFPGQGTALVGVLDAFWEEKGYVTPGAFQRFCNRTVPLARLEKRVFTREERLVASIDVAHHGAARQKMTASWRLEADDGTKAAGGRLAPTNVAVGDVSRLGGIDLPLRNLPAPARYRLAVSIEGTALENDWDVWVYPEPSEVPAAAPANVTITSSFDAAAEARLAAGEAVVLMIPPGKVAPDPKRPVALGFSSIFWNTAWTNGQAPHTLGLLCDPQHPAFASFPTDSHSNWQWWYPIHSAAALILDDLPRELQPIVQVIDDWTTNRKLGLVFEARVGRGRLLVTSIVLDDAVLDPVRRQLRASLLTYAGSDRFRPDAEVTADQIRSLIAP